jgi:hypothetical protein
MYDAITRIMQIVKLFGDDHVSFWLFLEHVGCVSDTAEEKNRQELEHPPAHGEAPSFRIYGRVCPTGYHTLPREILQDFKNIRLVCPITKKDSVKSNYGPDPRVRQITWETVDDFEYKEQGNRKIDNFRRKYQLLTKTRKHLPQVPLNQMRHLEMSSHFMTKSLALMTSLVMKSLVQNEAILMQVVIWTKKHTSVQCLSYWQGYTRCSFDRLFYSQTTKRRDKYIEI